MHAEEREQEEEEEEEGVKDRPAANHATTAATGSDKTTKAYSTLALHFSSLASLACWRRARCRFAQPHANAQSIRPTTRQSRKPRCPPPTQLNAANSASREGCMWLSSRTKPQRHWLHFAHLKLRKALHERNDIIGPLLEKTPALLTDTTQDLHTHGVMRLPVSTTKGVRLVTRVRVKPRQELFACEVVQQFAAGLSGLAGSYVFR